MEFKKLTNILKIYTLVLNKILTRHRLKKIKRNSMKVIAKIMVNKIKKVNGLMV